MCARARSIAALFSSNRSSGSALISGAVEDTPLPESRIRRMPSLHQLIERVSRLRRNCRLVAPRRGGSAAQGGGSVFEPVVGFCDLRWLLHEFERGESRASAARGI